MALLDRKDVNTADKWRVEDIFATDSMWEEEFDKVTKLVALEPVYMGKMAESAENLAKAMQDSDQLELQVERLYVYANLKFYEDMGNATYQAMAGKVQNLMADFYGKYAFIEPEILAIPEDTMAKYMEEDCMKEYVIYVKNILRQKPHILSAEMESMLAEVTKVSQGAKDIFGSFNNADLKFGTIKNEAGEEVELTHGRYSLFMESKDRQVRKNAYERIYDSYGSYINTLASCYQANVTGALFFAKARNYPDSLTMSLDGGNIPVSVYDGLIEAVRKHLPLMHRYVGLRKKALGLSELHMYDVYTPLVEDYEKKVSFEEAKETVKKGLAPLGQQYLDILQEGYDQGWIDVYENQGKRSGAFSWGTYGTHPYVCLNYQDNLNNMFTLAHEMGHAIHTYKSNAAQSHMYAGYRIFVAEVASTCNEALLIQYLIENSTEDKEKLYLINYFLEQFKSTMFRQTMFAEFEKKAHQMAQDGQILTAETLSQMYKQLNEDYFGPEMILDDRIALEWARIPHFYTPFYVYQYATGFAAAVAISRNILQNGDKAVKGYMDFLSGGSSDYPIELLKRAGVDMAKPDTLDGAFAVFATLLDEMEELGEKIWTKSQQ